MLYTGRRGGIPIFWATLLAAMAVLGCARTVAAAGGSVSVLLKPLREDSTIDELKQLAVLLEQFTNRTGINVHITMDPETADLDNYLAVVENVVDENNDSFYDLVAVDLSWLDEWPEKFIDLLSLTTTYTNPYTVEKTTSDAILDLISEQDQSVMSLDAVSGEVIALPLYIDYMVLYYRNDILSKYGVSPPQKLAELGRVCEDITSAEKKNNDKFTCILPMTSGYMDVTQLFASWFMAENNTPLVKYKNTVSFNTDKNVATLDMIISWIKSGFISDKLLDVSYEKLHSDFVEGNALFFYGYANSYSSINSVLGGSGENVAIADNITDALFTPVVAGTHLAMLRDDYQKGHQDKDAVAQVLAFLAGEEVQTARGFGLGVIPSLDKLRNDTTVCTSVPCSIFKNTAKASMKLPAAAASPKWNEAVKAMGPSFREILHLNVGASDGLNTAERRVNDAFQDKAVSNGLSTGGIVAISVIIPLFALLVLFSILCLLRRRRRQKKMLKDEEMNQAQATGANNQNNSSSCCNNNAAGAKNCKSNKVRDGTTVDEQYTTTRELSNETRRNTAEATTATITTNSNNINSNSNRNSNNGINNMNAATPRKPFGASNKHIFSLLLGIPLHRFKSRLDKRHSRKPESDSDYEDRSVEARESDEEDNVKNQVAPLVRIEEATEGSSSENTKNESIPAEGLGNDLQSQAQPVIPSIHDSDVQLYNRILSAAGIVEDPQSMSLSTDCVVPQPIATHSYAGETPYVEGQQNENDMMCTGCDSESSSQCSCSACRIAMEQSRTTNMGPGGNMFDTISINSDPYALNHGSERPVVTSDLPGMAPQISLGAPSLPRSVDDMEVNYNFSRTEDERMNHNKQKNIPYHTGHNESPPKYSGYTVGDIPAKYNDYYYDKQRYPVYNQGYMDNDYNAYYRQHESYEMPYNQFGNGNSSSAGWNGDIHHNVYNPSKSFQSNGDTRGKSPMGNLKTNGKRNATVRSNGASQNVRSSSSRQDQPKKFTVVHPYKPTVPDELEIKPGDVVTLRLAYDDGYAFGEVENTRKAGIFPLACLLPVGLEVGFPSRLESGLAPSDHIQQPTEQVDSLEMLLLSSKITEHTYVSLRREQEEELKSQRQIAALRERLTSAGLEQEERKRLQRRLDELELGI